MTAEVNNTANSEVTEQDSVRAVSRAEGAGLDSTRTKAEPTLMEQVVDRANLQRAYQRVKRNKVQQALMVSVCPSWVIF